MNIAAQGDAAGKSDPNRQDCGTLWQQPTNAPREYQIPKQHEAKVQTGNHEEETRAETKYVRRYQLILATCSL